ncbi:HeH/LEM domain-containing protein [Companilactobacillus futsaii]|nr:HeH/LEM domain-containing protein [Companilactobacillus futsaii]
MNKPNSSATVADLKAYLDSKGIKYDSSATKTDLQKLAGITA